VFWSKLRALKPRRDRLTQYRDILAYLIETDCVKTYVIQRALYGDYDQINKRINELVACRMIIKFSGNVLITQQGRNILPQLINILKYFSINGETD
jgi:predicted transcriptional regulator